jgi:nucleoside-diphosphate-sugar epimerase
MKVSLSDLDQISDGLGPDVFLMKDANIFITGGTGFMGKLFLESLIYFNKKVDLNVKVTVLTRDQLLFSEEYPHLTSEHSVKFLNGDIRDFSFPKDHYNFIIHAATEASAKLNVENPLLMSDVIVNGTRHVLDFAQHCSAQKVLFLSSGAVYGRQPDTLAAFPEDFGGAPDPLENGNAYGISKRMAEFLCATYARIYNINITTARCFAFVGPYLSLDKHFAIGNFINDGINNRDIVISGDGKPQRSYMYATDLIVWLLTLLLKGKSGEAYNVGSEEAITIEELAKKISDFFPGIKVRVLNQILATHRNQNYIPNVQKARDQLNLKQKIGLNEAIYKTIQYNL